jgi:flagellar hook-associated protein 1 FlgK
MSDLMRIGSSAMNAAYAQLQTTGQNIANASTPGYVRREVVLQEAGSMGSGGFVGRGVDAVAVQRVYDEFLVRESASSKASAAQDSARGDALQRLERLFADPATGVGAAFDDLVSSFADVTARPGEPSARSAVLARAETFAGRAATLDARLLELRDAAQGRMQNEVGKANDTLAALAALNVRIREARGSVGEPNALLDQRDKLLADLNGVLRANASIAQDGTISVDSQRGEALVVAGKASRLVLTGDPVDPTRVGVSVQRGNGTTLPLAASDIGGSLAGLIRFVEQDVDAARLRLGQITAAVASRFNEQQARGLDANGNAGQPMFSLGAPMVSSASFNTGDAQFSALVTDSGALKASDYELGFDGTDYVVTRLSDGVAQSFASLPQVFDGVSISLGSGSPAAGDRFVVRTASAFAAGTRSLLVNPSAIATALPVAAEAGVGNTGELRAVALDIGAIGPNTSQPVTITFTGPATFSISGPGTGNPTGLAFTPGMRLSYNGWDLTLSGAPAAGDTLRIGPTPDPATDNRNARAMQALGDATLVDGARVIDRFAELIGDVGIRAQSAQSARDMSQRLFDDAERSRSAMSGVNLDEEAARMMQYQQAYQAAAKVIATANEMFRALLEAASR